MQNFRFVLEEVDDAGNSVNVLKRVTGEGEDVATLARKALLVIAPRKSRKAEASEAQAEPDGY